VTVPSYTFLFAGTFAPFIDPTAVVVNVLIVSLQVVAQPIAT
jgi:hypothetical protein